MDRDLSKSSTQDLLYESLRLMKEALTRVDLDDTDIDIIEDSTEEIITICCKLEEKAAELEEDIRAQDRRDAMEVMTRGKLPNWTGD